MNKLLFSIIIILFSLVAKAQVPVGQWNAYIPNRKGLTLCEAGEKIYCLTETGIFYYNKSDNSIQKIGKIEGLSGINTRSIAYYSATNTVFIGYDDGTIDLIKNNNQITTLTDIYRKSFSSKTINKIQIINNLIYFCTNFGIVVYDPIKLEFKDTYIIGDGGYEIRINSIAIDNDYIYAATEFGIRKAPINSNQLPNYAIWERISYIPNGNKEFNALALFNNKLIASFKNKWAYSYKTYVVDETNQSYFTLNPDSESYTQELKVIDNRLLVIHKNHIGIYDNFNQPAEFYNKTIVYWGYIDLWTNDAIIDKDNNLWYADESWGLVKSNYNNETGEYKSPNGPSNNDAYYLSTGDGNTWLVPGAIEATGTNTYTTASVSLLDNNLWRTYNSSQIPTFSIVRDIIAVEQVPNNPNKIFCCSGTSGIIEIDFTDRNSPSVILHNDTTGSTLKPIWAPCASNRGSFRRKPKLMVN